MTNLWFPNKYSIKKDKNIVLRNGLVEQIVATRKGENLNKFSNFKIVFFTKFQNRIPFVDDEFPPSPRSLFYNTEDPSNHQVSHWINQAPVTYLEFVSTPKEEKLIWWFAQIWQNKPLSQKV